MQPVRSGFCLQRVVAGALCALLLLFGAPAHWGAKTSAFIVAVALGGAAVIANIRGNGIFGIFAANHKTEIVCGAAAVVLALLAWMPRVGRRRRSAPAGSRVAPQ